MQSQLWIQDTWPYLVQLATALVEAAAIYVFLLGLFGAADTWNYRRKNQIG